MKVTDHTKIKKFEEIPNVSPRIAMPWWHYTPKRKALLSKKKSYNFEY